MNPLGITTHDRYRRVCEPDVLDLLMLYGWAFEMRTGMVVRDAQAALDRWTGSGLGCVRGPDGVRRFDPAEVVNFFKFAGRRQGDGFWRERFITTGRRHVLDHHGRSFDAPPPPPENLPPKSFQVAWHREVNVAGHAPGMPIRLRIALPVRSDGLPDVTLGPITLPDSLPIEVDATDGRLEARLAVPPNAGTLSLGVRAVVEARPLPGRHRRVPPLSEAERALYTRGREGFVRVTPRVVALAKRLAPCTGGPQALIRHFWDYLIDELDSGILHYDEMNAATALDWVLEQRWFDCQLGSALLVALCRAVGIPARIVGGVLLYPTSPSQHFWAEAWLDELGWMPLDTVCADLSAAGGDRAWRDHFFGRLDYRMQTVCLPRHFDAVPAARLPRMWHALPKATAGGIEVRFHATDTGALVYLDGMMVREVPAGGAAEVPASSLNAGPL
ncbi:MAG: transglutaminase domain-containing protein [Casimicrobiaceae bacterium]